LNKKTFFFQACVLVALTFFIFSNSVAQDDHKSHEGHDHAVHEHKPGETCSAESSLSEIVLSPEQIKNSGIKTGIAGSGNLAREISLTGEIVVNSERLVHHVARTSGIADKINVFTGDFVRKNDVLAILDSAELGQAKSEYYELFNQTGISLFDLQRAQTISQSAGKLLVELNKKPQQLEILQQQNFGDLGEYRSRLISAYAEYLTSKKSFERKQKLFKDKIISENDFLNSQNAFDKAQAAFYSDMDSARFEVSQRLYDAEQKQRINEFRLRTAERKLLILGMTAAEIEELKKHGAKIQQECTDSTCKDCSFSTGRHFHPGDEDQFSKISIKAGRTGTVIARNIEAGEEVEGNRIIFSLADLSSLWVVLQAPAKDISLIKNGMETEITSAEGEKTIGRVIMVGPTINEQTRTAAVRVSLSNDSGRWRPGGFANGTIKIAADNLPVVVRREAVQNINGDNVVFVSTARGFKPVDVKTGREDSDNIEILAGLKAGMNYVSAGAFTLKAIMVTSGMDPHAGHGH
jgi:cobalt-zinc-cadmium efflux system membrane fusion protein